MAFSNAPQFNTYKQMDIDLIATPTFRSGNLSVQKDSFLLNCYYERGSFTNQTKYTVLKKRPGLVATDVPLGRPNISSPVRGAYYDPDTRRFYWCVGNQLKVRQENEPSNLVVQIGTIASFTGIVGFTPYLAGDGTRQLIISDGTNLYIHNTNSLTITPFTGPPITNYHDPNLAFYNGYLFLVERNTGKIWNSDPDNPTVWPAGSFIQTEIASDNAIRICRVKNYLICFGTSTIEYFWDAGAASPGGSPLARNDTPVRNVGYVEGFCAIGDSVYFVGCDENQNVSVFMLNNFKVENISNSFVDKTIQSLGTTRGQTAQLNEKRGNSISVDGMNFYVLQFSSGTWVYDIEAKLWYNWSSAPALGNNGRFAIEHSLAVINGNQYVIFEGQNTLSIMSSTVYTDLTFPFPMQYTTEPLDFGTHNWKIAHRLYVHGSRGIPTIQIQWSDDDWQTIANERTMIMDATSPFISQLGRFRVRSYRLTYRGDQPFQLYKLSTNLNIGQH